MNSRKCWEFSAKTTTVAFEHTKKHTSYQFRNSRCNESLSNPMEIKVNQRMSSDYTDRPLCIAFNMTRTSQEFAEIALKLLQHLTIEGMLIFMTFPQCFSQVLLTDSIIVICQWQPWTFHNRMLTGRIWNIFSYFIRNISTATSQCDSSSVYPAQMHLHSCQRNRKPCRDWIRSFVVNDIRPTSRQAFCVCARRDC